MFKRSTFTRVVILLVIAFGFLSSPVYAAPSIVGITDNKSSYPNNQIPQYEKLEISFSVNSNAVNLFLPYAATLPPGLTQSIDGGISVDATFTSPSGQTYKQPAFYFQQFDHQVKDNKDWLYPTANYSWKVRFSPHETGTWQYVLTATDASGTTTSSSQTFIVNNSSSHGFVKPAANDNRYFEYSDGTYFPSLGFNLNAGNLDINNPILGNTEKFTSMGQNGIQVSRVWISQKSIYGSAWGAWLSPNPAHIKNEALMGLSHSTHASSFNYQNLVPPVAPSGSNLYMWLNFDETMSADGEQYQFTPGRLFGWNQPPISLKPGVTYRIRVRYNAQGLIGPADPAHPYGFVVKYANFGNWNSVNSRSYQPGVGTILAATYPGGPWTNYQETPNNPTWRILEGTFSSTNQNFLPNHLALTMENVADPNGTASDPTGAPKTSGGHVFVDQVWLEESLGNNQYGPNLIYKPDMDHHKYINERNAYALDQILEVAHQNQLGLKMVMLEKNDLSFRFLNPDGSFSSTNATNNFWGNGRETTSATQVRFLQKAWWRYMQARWGYSTSVHSWELLNEGPTGNNEGHWTLADEFGEYMGCGVFGIDLEEQKTNPGYNCTPTHPNSHMVTTSFFSEGFPWNFWNNTDGVYNDLDYADYHNYVDENKPEIPTEVFDDAALNTLRNSQWRGANETGGADMPVLRGETGWRFLLTTDIFNTNASDGLWLHNFIWGGINSSGLIEHFWVGAPTTHHIYKSGSHDHRSKYGNYYRFIKDVPLNNGHYVDAEATVGNTNLRAWGQKDLTNGRSHLWIQNSHNTWKNKVDGVNPSPVTTTVTLDSFTPNTSYPVEWWDTYTGEPTSTQTLTTNSSGSLTLSISNLTSDIAVRIGDYTDIQPPSLLGDVNNDGQVNMADITQVISDFGNSEPPLPSDANGDGIVNIFDYTIVVSNFGS